MFSEMVKTGITGKLKAVCTEKMTSVRVGMNGGQRSINLWEMT